MEALGSNPEKDTDDILKRKRDQARRDSDNTRDKTQETKKAVDNERRTDHEADAESVATTHAADEASVVQGEVGESTATEVIEDSVGLDNAEITTQSPEFLHESAGMGEEGELFDAEEQVQSAEELTQRVDGLLETVAQQLSDKEEATNEMFRNIRKVTSAAAPAAAFDVTTGEVNEARVVSEELEDAAETVMIDDAETSPDDPIVVGGGSRPPILPPNPGNPTGPNFGANTVLGTAAAIGGGAALAVGGAPPIPGMGEAAPRLERRRRNSPVGPFLLGLGVGWLLKRRSANRRINSLNKELKSSSEQLKKSKEETELLLIEKKKSDAKKAELERSPISAQQESLQQPISSDETRTKTENLAKTASKEIVTTQVVAKVSSLEKQPEVSPKTAEKAQSQKFSSMDVLQQVIDADAVLIDKKEVQSVGRAEIEHSIKQELVVGSDAAEKVLLDKSPDWVVATQLAVERKSALPKLEQWQVAEIRKKHPELYEKLTKRADAGVLLGAAGGYAPLPLTAPNMPINTEGVLPSPSKSPDLVQQITYHDNQPSSKLLPITVVFVVIIGVVLFLSLK